MITLRYAILDGLCITLETKGQLYVELLIVKNFIITLLIVKDLAPEIVDEKEYSEGVDIWCLGILMYEMLYGFPPFHSKEKQETFEKIRTQKLVFHDDIRTLSEEAKDLVTRVN